MSAVKAYKLSGLLCVRLCVMESNDTDGGLCIIIRHETKYIMRPTITTLCIWICTYTWSKWLNISIQGLDPVHRDILFIAKVNVKDFSHLLVSSQTLDQASVPALQIKNTN